MSIALRFDYAALDPETRIVVQQKTSEIKARVRRTRQDIIEIGEELIEVKERLGHGHFGEWIRAEFDWVDRTARSFMEVAGAFKSEIISDLDITPTALQSLAAPSVPEPARREAIARSSNGEHIGTKESKQIIEKYKPAPASRAPVATPSREPDEEEEEEIEDDLTDDYRPLLITDPGQPAYPPQNGERRKFGPFQNKYCEVDDFFRWVQNLGGIEGASQGWSAEDREDMAKKLERLYNERVPELLNWISYLRRRKSK